MEGGGYGGKKDKLVPVTNRDPHITGITSQSYSTVPKQAPFLRKFNELV